MHGRVLVIAGSDSGGGAGIQADIKAVAAMGGYAATVLTALTAQNTLGVQEVLPVPSAFVRRQAVSVLDDIGADAVKLGMLGGTEVIGTVADLLTDNTAPLVLDPVMVAKGGHMLLPPDALDALRRRLLPLATLLTPNVPEAEALTGQEVASVAGMEAAANALLRQGAAAVLIKGGHLPGPVCTDLLVTPDGVLALHEPRVDTRHTHGTGCTLASAVAAGLAQGMHLHDAVRRARRFVQSAISGAPGYGAGHGPLDHGVTLDSRAVALGAPAA